MRALLLIVALLISGSVMADDTGWLPLTTYSGYTSSSNAAADDGAEATFTLPADEYNESFTGVQITSTVPTGATIIGIELRAELRQSGSGQGIVDLVKLIKGGTTTGDNKTDIYNLTATGVKRTYGGPTDLWGLTLSDTDVNASNFGFRLGFTEVDAEDDVVIRIDVVEIRIYYTPSGGEGEGEGEGESNFFFLF